MIDQLLHASHTENALPFRLERFEGMNAVLAFESVDEDERQQVLWPIKKLPDGIKLGQRVWLQLSTKETREAEKEGILRRLLEEIIT